MFGKNVVRGHHRRMALEAKGPVARTNAQIYEDEGRESPWKARQGLCSQTSSGEGGFIVVDHFGGVSGRCRR